MPERSTDSGSFLTGSNPLHEDVSLFLIQVLVIVLTAKLLAIPLRYLRQPAVIAEVIGGILLGPSALCRLPGFKDNIFPDSSLSKLKLMADFGLILYLYLVGMELDPQRLSTQFKQSAFISLAGIALPFGVGVGVSKLIFDSLSKTETSFTSFFVFTGVAMSITAFPVLARILAERKLLSTDVGQTTIAAAAVDDAVAWCLLVLVVALINNPSSSVVAVYVFLAVIAWAAFLWFAIRPLLLKVVKFGHENDTYASVPVYCTFIVLCISAWFTQGVGVHAIFGAFLTGIITPHEYGFALHMTEKIEDLVTTLLLPLYFAYSGLKTRIDQLDDGYSWEIVFLVIVAACGGKIIGCTSAARLSGLKWRESLTIGLLMNTKGLVELIVLNLGLDSGVITPQIFTIFVVMALATTFMTVPLVSIVYPFDVYMYSDKKKLKEELSTLKPESGKRNILACLPNLKTSSGMMSLTQLLVSGKQADITVLRLIELESSSLSRMMMSNDGTSETLRSDPAMILFSTFGQMHPNIHIRSILSVSGIDAFADNINSACFDLDSDLVIFPVDARVTLSRTSVDTQVSRLFTLATKRSVLAVLYDRGFGATPPTLSLPSSKALFSTERPPLAPGASIPTKTNFSVVLLLLGNEEENAELLRLMQRVEFTNGDLDLSIITTSSFSSTTEKRNGGDTARNSEVDATLQALKTSSSVSFIDLSSHTLPCESSQVTTVSPTEIMSHLLEASHSSQIKTHLIVVGKSVYDNAAVSVVTEDVQATGSSIASTKGSHGKGSGVTAILKKREAKVPLKQYLRTKCTSSFLVVQPRLTKLDFPTEDVV